MLKLATDDHWRSLVGTEPPGVWFGLVHIKYGEAVSIGCVYEALDGRWWVSFKGERHPFSMMRGARDVLEFAREQQIEMHALADKRVAGSEKWLERCSFKPTLEVIEDHRVYKWTP